MGTSRPTSKTGYWDTKNISTSGCSTYRADLGFADPRQCNVDEKARRENDNFISGNRGSNLSAPAVGSFIRKADFDTLRNRFNTEKNYWDVTHSFEAVDIGEEIGINHYNNFVSLINKILNKSHWRNWWNYYLDNYSPKSSTKSVGEEITRADWKNLIDDFNTIKNSCVCNRDCSCNAVCGSYQNCRCNSYNSASGCGWVTDITWFSPSPDSKNNPNE